MNTQIGLVLGVLAIAALAAGTGYLWLRLARVEEDRRRIADELNRRLSELFSLQELSYVLSDSLQLDRIVDHVVRYAMRFLEARGALVALTGERASEPLVVAAADGTLAPQRGASIRRSDTGLVVRSVGRERLELVRNSGGGSVVLIAGINADAAAAVPLRAHGAVVGTLVVADPRGGQFASEDLRLISTLATHTAVVIANARFFDLVRRAKEEWETAFDAMSEGLAVVDDGGRITRANRALAALLGREVAEVQGHELASSLLDHPGSLNEFMEAARKGGRPVPLVARSRVGRAVRINAARMPAVGPISPLVVLVEDVTEQQTMESQLIQSEKLAAVGQLVSGVAHELNNPLTSIAGLSEFLLEQKELGENDRGHLRVIHEQSERAGRIVRNLLTFARKAPAERERVDLTDVLQRTLLLMSYDLRLKDVTLEKDFASLLPDVLGDRHALQQVVLNLLTNAAQAVSGNPPDRPRTVRASTWFDGKVHVRIQDSGPGISDEVARQLFTPFFTTKEPGQGTGLGLSISYSIVEAHGGKISVEPTPAGGGAAFHVEFPPAPADAPARLDLHRTPAPPTRPTRASRASKDARPVRSILLVDDDQAVRRMVQALFGREGHAVEVARNGQHALELAANRVFDLIIADGRSASTGKLLVEELAERMPHLKARTLVATGDVRPATDETLARLGLRYVRKPFNLRDLRDEAARVWAATES
ncbi:MAG TPA: ATP-binding protein [Gemmatimonadales bacterium]|nr:ATP-binding protein [Gemmatimonadales bacterium]